MFSSNQIIKISGTLEEAEIKRVLDVILDIAGHERSWDGKRIDCHYTYQISTDGAFCIGYRYNEPHDGWEDFQFGFDPNIVAKAIKNQLTKLKFPDTWDGWDGSTEKGFLAENIENSFADEKDGIKNPWYGIVKFSPYTCFYHK